MAPHYQLKQPHGSVCVCAYTPVLAHACLHMCFCACIHVYAWAFVCVCAMCMHTCVSSFSLYSWYYILKTSQHQCTNVRSLTSADLTFFFISSTCAISFCDFSSTSSMRWLISLVDPLRMASVSLLSSSCTFCSSDCVYLSRSLKNSCHRWFILVTWPQKTPSQIWIFWKSEV